MERTRGSSHERQAEHEEMVQVFFFYENTKFWKHWSGVRSCPHSTTGACRVTALNITGFT